MHSQVSELRDAIVAAGMEPPSYIERGRLHRFPSVGKGPSDRAGWCWLSDDGTYGAFGDWRTGVEGTWRAQSADINPEEWRRQAAKARKAARKSERASQRTAAEKARAIWDSATPADHGHTYLLKKCIKPYCARVDRHGNLVVPVYVNRALSSLQFIKPNGEKMFLKGGRVKAGYCPIEGTDKSVVVCEGFATGATIAEAVGCLVVVAFNAANLLPVAEYTRRRFPNGDLVVAADTDRATPGNPGLNKATLAARAVNARLAVPEFPPGVPGSDFNDLEIWSRGRHARSIQSGS